MTRASIFSWTDCTVYQALSEYRNTSVVEVNPMPGIGRIAGLVLTMALFALSTFVYLRTGDWVAIVFALGSLGYFAFFLAFYRRDNS